MTSASSDERVRLLAAVFHDGAPIAEAADRVGVTAEVGAAWVRAAVDAGEHALATVGAAADADTIGGADTSAPEIEPDPRASLANERTFLAWNRTALAFIGAGVALGFLLPDTTLPRARHAIAIAPIAVGAALGWASYGRWAAVQLALRQRRPLPRSPLPQLLTAAVVLGAVAGAIVALFIEDT